jgi:uncharacterized cupin superfamily protein
MNSNDRVLSTDVMTESLTTDELSPSDVVAGSPRVASSDLEVAGDISIGVWEISPGSSH